MISAGLHHHPQPNPSRVTVAVLCQCGGSGLWGNKALMAQMAAGGDDEATVLASAEQLIRDFAEAADEAGESNFLAIFKAKMASHEGE